MPFCFTKLQGNLPVSLAILSFLLVLIPPLWCPSVFFFSALITWSMAGSQDQIHACRSLSLWSWFCFHHLTCPLEMHFSNSPGSKALCLSLKVDQMRQDHGHANTFLPFLILHFCSRIKVHIADPHGSYPIFSFLGIVLVPLRLNCITYKMPHLWNGVLFKSFFFRVSFFLLFLLQ